MSKEHLKFKDQIVFMYCSDLRKTSAFYEDLLGFPLVVDQGSCRIVRVADRGGGYLGYCERLTGEMESEGVIFTFVVSTKGEVNAWHTQLLERGVAVQDPPKYNPTYGIYHFFFQDPDGYNLEIQSFEDPEWNNTSRED